MKRNKGLWAFFLSLLMGYSATAGVIGYVNSPFLPGDNLFQNPLYAPTNNLLSSLFGPATPNNTTVSLWDATANAYGTTAVFLGGAWSIDFELKPGTGARLNTALAFTNTFVGTLLDRAGGGFDPGDELVPAPLFSGPNGIYLLGDKIPVASSGNNLFLYVIGRGPNTGEQFTRLDASTQTYITSTYLGGGVWDIVPSVRVGDAGFFNIGPVPEPSAGVLGIVGIAVFFARRQHRT